MLDIVQWFFCFFVYVEFMIKLNLYWLLTVVLLISCKKEGCTNSTATNYSAAAKVDDESCVYESNLVFWFDDNTQTILSSSGVTSLSYYLDGSFIGTFNASTGFDSAPECGDATAFSKAIAYDLSPTKTLSYRVEDQDENEHFSGSVTAIGDACVPVQLVY